jgi:GDSL-like lipase/acylhydrolase family protein
MSLVAAVVAATALTGPGVASAATPNFKHYVALGDSYTAGPLIPFQRLDPLTCFRSTNNYAAWLADGLKIRDFRDASCSSADTTNMAQPQSIPLGTAAPQFSALKKSTDLVTIGIGGNDFSVFGTLVGDCPKVADQDPTGSPCQDSFTVDGVDTMKQRLVGTQARVTEVLREVHVRSPKAKVLLVGYPRIAPPTGYCPDILPFADGDVRWLDSVEQALNQALANAAAADGRTTYVDTYGPSLGHDACATGGAAWIQGQALDLLGAFPYHPRKSGMVGVANVIRKTLNAGTTAGTGVPSVTAGVPVADPNRAGELMATAGLPGR